MGFFKDLKKVIKGTSNKPGKKHIPKVEEAIKVLEKIRKKVK